MDLTLSELQPDQAAVPRPDPFKAASSQLEIAILLAVLQDLTQQVLNSVVKLAASMVESLATTLTAEESLLLLHFVTMSALIKLWTS